MNAEGGILANGTLTGTLTESTLSFTIAVTAGGLRAIQSCSATIEGVGDVTVSTTNGMFSGAASCSASFFGQFALTKE